MRNRLARLIIGRFGKQYNYDVSYMLHILEKTPSVLASYSRISRLARYRKVVPATAHGTAGIVGTLAEDCGPCVQISVDMARKAGMPDDQIGAVVAGDLPAMDADTAAAYRFAAALVTRTPDDGDVREAVRRRWGDAGIIELTLACQLARIHPMVKAGLGYATCCAEVSVGTQTVIPARRRLSP